AGVIDASARVDGLATLLGEQLGIKAGEGGGSMRIHLAELALPLTTLAPYASVLVPGLEVGGKIALRPADIVGTPSEMIRGLPRELSLSLVFDRVRVVDAARGVRVGGLDGKLELAKKEDFALDGALALHGFAHRAAALEHADVELHAGTERLAWPIPGHL